MCTGPKTLYPLRGIVPSLNTPFDTQGRAGLPAFDRLVQHEPGRIS